MVKRATVVGIVGCTNAGKSTLAKSMQKEMERRFCSIKIICQDDYFKEKEHVTAIPNSENSAITFYDYDSIQALDAIKLRQDIETSIAENDFVIVEGNMVTDLPEVYALLNYSVFLTINSTLCRDRRMKRDYDPPDEPGYYDQIVWPSYEQILKKAKLLKDISFIDAGTLPTFEHIIENSNKQLLNLMRVQREEISADKTIAFAKDDCCGAISVFMGTTRDVFDEKTVLRLEYEAYENMVYAEMRRLCEEVRRLFPTIRRIAIIHRIGEVEVGETSIIIVTSSPQRKDAIAATEWLINRVKATVPIWKKEIYGDGSCSWKVNHESVKNKT